MNQLVCHPKAFQVTDVTVIPNRVAVMMPFSQKFDTVYDAIKNACKSVGLECNRADDIWLNTTIIQDIFDLICTSSIVICDFSEKNPNVFYEAGIAHTLGRTVIPIVQNTDDIPFDLRQHRFLSYLHNNEGLATLTDRLAKKLEGEKKNWQSTQEYIREEEIAKASALLEKMEEDLRIDKLLRLKEMTSPSAAGVSVDLNEIGGVRVADEDNSLHEHRSNPHPR